MFKDSCIIFPELLVPAYCPLVRIFVGFILFCFVWAFSFQVLEKYSILWQLPCCLILQDIPGSYQLFLATHWNISPKNLYCFNEKQYFKTTIIDTGLVFQKYNQCYWVHGFNLIFFAFRPLIHLEFILVHIVMNGQILYSYKWLSISYLKFLFPQWLTTTL